MTLLVERGTPRRLISRALVTRVAVVRTLVVVGAQAPGGDVFQLVSEPLEQPVDLYTA